MSADVREYDAFWAWFADHADELHAADDYNDILVELDRRVTALGFAWEVGPSQYDPEVRAFALSPDGDRARLGATRAAVARAPHLLGWHFLPARPPKSGWGRAFVLDADRDCAVHVDASTWRYRLFECPDGLYGLDVYLEPALQARGADAAVDIVLESELGEEAALRWIARFRTHGGEPPDEARPIETLSAHLAQAIARRRQTDG